MRGCEDAVEEWVKMPRVVVVEFDGDVRQSFAEAFRLIGIGDMNTEGRSVVVKVGVFKPNAGQFTTVDVIDALVGSFDKAPKICLVESDNYEGPAPERLEIWNRVFSERVVPFNLSTDEDTKEVRILGESVRFSHVLFKPNVFVSTHVPRRYQGSGPKERLNIGSVLKNLLGLIPDIKKDRFHERLPAALLDIYEAIGGIDLAVLDGTYTHLEAKRKRRRVQTNMLVIGRDAISVEAVGAYLLGFDPMEMPVIQEAMDRGLGEGDISRIEILGSPIEDLRERIVKSFRELSPAAG